MSTKRTREAKDVKAAVPAVQTATQAAAPPSAGETQDRQQRPHLYWPKTQAKPTKWVRVRPAVPCERCDRVLNDYGSQAVICDGGVSDKSGKAYLRCRVCGHKFTMPIG